MKTLAVIPARGGSKGIPRKNLYPCAGMPLVWWSIEAARYSKLIDRTVVSTEDLEIRDYAESCGAEVLDRPEELARDGSSTLDVLIHAVNAVPGRWEELVCLQPTSPFRPPDLIDQAIRRFRYLGVDTLATCKRSYEYEYGSQDNIPRQDMEGWLYDDGNVYVHKADSIRAGRWRGPDYAGLEVPPGCSLEIDSYADLYMADGLLKAYYEGKPFS